MNPKNVFINATVIPQWCVLLDRGLVWPLVDRDHRCWETLFNTEDAVLHSRIIRTQIPVGTKKPWSKEPHLVWYFRNSPIVNTNSITRISRCLAFVLLFSCNPFSSSFLCDLWIFHCHPSFHLGISTNDDNNDAKKDKVNKDIPW